MAEQRLSMGKLLTLEHVAAASNIGAGQMVGISGVSIYTLNSGTTGFGATATQGYRFIGILDDSVSAGQVPITVWTDGVFLMDLNPGSISGSLYPGKPVWAESGVVTTPGANGDMAIGTLVGIQGGTWGATGAGRVRVRIRPGALNWTIALASALSSTAPLPGAFPELSAR